MSYRGTAAELAESLAEGRTTSVRVTQDHLDRIGAVDGELHAFLHVDADGALEQAAASDARREGAEPLDVRPHPVEELSRG